MSLSPGILFGTITSRENQALALFTNVVLCNSWEGFAGGKTMQLFFRWGLFSFYSGRPGV